MAEKVRIVQEVPNPDYKYYISYGFPIQPGQVDRIFGRNADGIKFPKFNSLAAAIAFALKQGWEYEIESGEF